MKMLNERKDSILICIKHERVKIKGEAQVKNDETMIDQKYIK